jgi:NitT/TauT family transport system substrate-binding protein
MRAARSRPVNCGPRNSRRWLPVAATATGEGGEPEMSTRNRIAAAVAAGFAVTFAGQALALDEVVFGTNWVPEAEHGGFYQAVADGTYEKYGLKVTLIPKAERAMLLGGKLTFYMEGNLLGTFDAVQNDIPVISVGAMFQKDPQIFMTHPEAGVKTFADLAKVPVIFIGDDLFVTGWQWMKAAYPGFKDEQRKPYPYNLAGFLADKMSGNQGYLTSEPYAVQNEGGFTPDVFLMADAGYTTYSTMIVGMSDYVKANPDVTKRFVEASIVGWYNYLYGDNKAANDLIKSQNPDMTDGQIEFTIGKMKEYGLLESGEAIEKGIGCMTDARVAEFYKKMVDAGVVKGGLDLSNAYTTGYVCKGVGMDLKKG